MNSVQSHSSPIVNSNLFSSVIIEYTYIQGIVGLEEHTVFHSLRRYTRLALSSTKTSIATQFPILRLGQPSPECNTENLE